MNVIATLIAQTQAPTSPAPIPTSPSPAAFFLPALLLAMVVFMLLSARSQKKRERRNREQMFAAMARNNRVQTVGGIIGTVLSIKDNEVVLKVDESTNTKMTFAKSAIQTVLSGDAASAAESR